MPTIPENECDNADQVVDEIIVLLTHRLQGSSGALAVAASLKVTAFTIAMFKDDPTKIDNEIALLRDLIQSVVEADAQAEAEAAAAPTAPAALRLVTSEDGHA